MYRSTLRAAVALTAAVTALTSCTADTGEEPAAPSVESASTFRDAPVAGVNLRDGEIVLTFDDGPATSSAAVATLLQSKGITGLFFAVSHHLGSVEGGAARLDSAGVAKLDAVLDAGHVVGNHTHDHCIQGASACGGRGMTTLSAAEARRQIETADVLIRAAIASAGHDASRYLPFFRSPGNAWSPALAQTLSQASLPSNAYGPVAWDVPRRGEEDFRCWSEGKSVTSCAARYVSAFQAMPRGGQRAVVLVHDNFTQARELTERFVNALAGTRTKAGNPVRFVHPRCIVGCTR